MPGSKGAHRPRSKRTQSQGAEASQAQGPAGQLQALNGTPPHGGPPLASPRDTQRPQTPLVWRPVLPLQPGAGLPRALQGPAGGFPAHRSREGPRPSARAAPAASRNAAERQGVAAAPAPARQSGTAAAAPPLGFGALSPRVSSRAGLGGGTDTQVEAHVRVEFLSCNAGCKPKAGPLLLLNQQPVQVNEEHLFYKAKSDA